MGISYTQTLNLHSWSLPGVLCTQCIQLFLAPSNALLNIPWRGTGMQCSGKRSMPRLIPIPTSSWPRSPLGLPHSPRPMDTWLSLIQRDGIGTDTQALYYYTIHLGSIGPGMMHPAIWQPFTKYAWEYECHMPHAMPSLDLDHLYSNGVPSQTWHCGVP